MIADSPRLFVSLYLDEDVTNQLAPLLQQRGFDVVSVVDLGRAGLTDEEQLRYAAEQKRVIFTYNIADFVQLARTWQLAGHSHAGILVSEQFSRRQLGELLRRLLNFLDRVTPEEMENTVRHLGAYR